MMGTRANTRASTKASTRAYTRAYTRANTRACTRASTTARTIRTHTGLKCGEVDFDAEFAEDEALMLGMEC
jgi:hypothetical protein